MSRNAENRVFVLLAFCAAGCAHTPIDSGTITPLQAVQNADALDGKRITVLGRIYIGQHSISLIGKDFIKSDNMNDCLYAKNFRNAPHVGKFKNDSYYYITGIFHKYYADELAESYFSCIGSSAIFVEESRRR